VKSEIVGPEVIRISAFAVDATVMTVPDAAIASRTVSPRHTIDRACMLFPLRPACLSRSEPRYIASAEAVAAGAASEHQA
jgi:hypothetical protein